MLEFLRKLFGTWEVKPPVYQIEIPGLKISLPELIHLHIGDDIEGPALEFDPPIQVTKQFANWLVDAVVGKWAMREVGSVVFRMAGGIVVKDHNGVQLIRFGV